MNPYASPYGYQPMMQPQPMMVPQQPPKSNAPLVITVIVVFLLLLAAGAAAAYYLWYVPMQEKKIADENAQKLAAAIQKNAFLKGLALTAPGAISFAEPAADGSVTVTVSGKFKALDSNKTVSEALAAQGVSLGVPKDVAATATVTATGVNIVLTKSPGAAEQKAPSTTGGAAKTTAPLTTEQLVALSAAGVTSLTPKQLEAITPEQIKRLSSAQLAALAPTEAAYGSLTEDAQAALAKIKESGLMYGQAITLKNQWEVPRTVFRFTLPENKFFLGTCNMVPCVYTSEKETETQGTVSTTQTEAPNVTINETGGKFKFVSKTNSLDTGVIRYGDSVQLVTAESGDTVGVCGDTDTAPCGKNIVAMKKPDPKGWTIVAWTPAGVNKDANGTILFEKDLVALKYGSSTGLPMSSCGYYATGSNLFGSTFSNLPGIGLPGSCGINVSLRGDSYDDGAIGWQLAKAT